MAHVTPAEFVDLAEGVCDTASAPHLAECDRCRQQLADVRRMLTAAAASDVPEPSPLFWDHLSARVREAVAGEPPPRSAVFLGGWWMRAATGVAVGAVIAGAVAGSLGHRTPEQHQAPVVVQEPPDPAALLGWGEDPSLDLVADFSRTLDWDDLREQLVGSGRVDASVGELDGAERRELGRLLKEELAREAGGTGRL
jgi:hypothetical protein